MQPCLPSMAKVRTSARKRPSSMMMITNMYSDAAMNFAFWSISRQPNAQQKRYRKFAGLRPWWTRPMAWMLATFAAKQSNNTMQTLKATCFNFTNCLKSTTCPWSRDGLPLGQHICSCTWCKAQHEATHSRLMAENTSADFRTKPLHQNLQRTNNCHHSIKKFAGLRSRWTRARHANSRPPLLRINRGPRQLLGHYVGTPPSTWRACSTTNIKWQNSVVGRADVKTNVAWTNKSSHITWNTFKSKKVMNSFMLQTRQPLSSSTYSERIIGSRYAIIMASLQIAGHVAAGLLICSTCE